jgi:dipeptidyl aminopeptidase/acylaminoacyl peptidase
MRTSFLRLLLAALLPALAAGCLPNATWLPDSSGFVYTGGKTGDALYLYDLDKKASRVLVEKGAGPAWPAVSPDGKRIAVVRQSDDGPDHILKVIVFDRNGKEVHHSPKLKWTPPAKPGPGDGSDKLRGWAEPNPVVLLHPTCWAGDQDKLLIRTDGGSALYDLKTDSLNVLDGVPCFFGNTLIRPDGKGFLAGTKDGLAFVDWDGKEQEIVPTLKDAFPQLGLLLASPYMHSSRWDGSTAVVSWDDLRLKIDTDKLAFAWEHFTPALSEDKKVIQDQVQLAGGTVIRAVELTKRYTKDQPPLPSHGKYRVEVLKKGTKEPKVLMDDAVYFMISPSPDGKKAVVKCAKEPLDWDLFFLIDESGDVAAQIDPFH